MTEELWQVGAHQAQLESPDVFLLRAVGDVSEEETMQLIALAQPRGAGEGPHFWLVDATHIGHLTPQARRRAGSWPVPPWHWGTAVFGVSFAQRLLASMLWGAAKVLRRDVEPVVLFAEEAEARAWIAAERERRTAAAPAGVADEA